MAFVEPLTHETIKDITQGRPDKQLMAWEGLGNSNNKSEEQIREAQRVVMQFLQDKSRDTIAFTDGSALGNQGPVGGQCRHLLDWS